MVARVGLRYAKLVEAIGESLEHSYGWQSEAARRLGVTRSFISRLAAGTRFKARPETVDRAISATGLSRAFFYHEKEPTPEEYQRAATFRSEPLPGGTAPRNVLLDLLPLIRKHWPNESTVVQKAMAAGMYHAALQKGEAD